MKIENLAITNFRGIKTATLSDLETMVVIAGQNGSGKSCVLDAVRLLKSVYGGYQQNEWHQWMGEFQINFSNSNDLVNLRTVFGRPDPGRDGLSPWQPAGASHSYVFPLPWAFTATRRPHPLRSMTHAAQRREQDLSAGPGG